MKTLKLLLVATLVISIARYASAANYSIQAAMVNAYLPGLIPVSPLPNTSMNLNSPHILEFEFTLHASGFNAALSQRGFGNMLFNIVLNGNSPVGQNGNSLTPFQVLPGFPNWFPINPNVDINGTDPGGGGFTRWQFNENVGTSAEMEIFLDLAVIADPPHPQDPRPIVGASPGTLVGKVWLLWDGIGPESLSVNLVTLDGLPTVSYSQISDGHPVQDLDAVFTGTTLNFGVQPGVGDFDADGDVDGADFIAWQTNFPTTSGASPANGDTDYDGDVDGADFAIWKGSFPASPSPGTVPVPEPAAWILLAIGGLIAWRQRR